MSGLAQRDAVFFRGDLQTIMPPRSCLIYRGPIPEWPKSSHIDLKCKAKDRRARSTAEATTWPAGQFDEEKTSWPCLQSPFWLHFRGTSLPLR